MLINSDNRCQCGWNAGRDRDFELHGKTALSGKKGLDLVLGVTAATILLFALEEFLS